MSEMGMTVAKNPQVNPREESGSKDKHILDYSIKTEGDIILKENYLEEEKVNNISYVNQDHLSEEKTTAKPTTPARSFLT